MSVALLLQFGFGGPSSKFVVVFVDIDVGGVGFVVFVVVAVGSKSFVVGVICFVVFKVIVVVIVK